MQTLRKLPVMHCFVRPTLFLINRLTKQVRRAAAVRGIRVSTFTSGSWADALKRREPTEPPPFRLVTVRGVHARPGVDLDRTRALEAEDDEERFKNVQR